MCVLTYHTLEQSKTNSGNLAQLHRPTALHRPQVSVKSSVSSVSLRFCECELVATALRSFAGRTLSPCFFDCASYELL